MTFKSIQQWAGTCLPALVLLFALCASAALAPAQAPPSSVHELAQRVDHHYDALSSLKASFTESYSGLGMNRTESGTLLLRKPGQMRWDYSVPKGKIFLLDGKYAWFYTQGGAQVQRVPAKELDDLRSPLRFLLGHTQLEKELTGLTMKAASNGLYTLTGLPKGQENRVTRLALTVSPSGTIVAIEFEEPDGAITRFTFSGEQPDAVIPAQLFHFTPPPGVPIVDALPPV